MINVTKTYLPSRKKLDEYIDKIYSSNWLTNNGPLVNELEKKLRDYLGVRNIVLVSNGTVALEVAYRALDIKGSVITTPFSFVATTSSLFTSNLKPVFSDIDQFTFNLDANLIKSKISKDVSAILPVHVFGNACEIEEIENISKEYNLKVIYDAAHTFDVKYKNTSVCNFGDISTLSFHATKLFHTIEGGALIINDDNLVEKVRYLINFGIKNQLEIVEPGVNGKMNEFQAAMGLCVLDDIEKIISSRKLISDLYEAELSGYVNLQKQNNNSTKNYSYFPVVFENEDVLLSIENKLNDLNIYPRRYFFPSLDDLPYISNKQHMQISRKISKTILCLPIYPGLDIDIVQKIINIIKKQIVK